MSRPSWQFWLGTSNASDASINSNVLKQTYIDKFLDVNGTLTVRWDASINGNLMIGSSKNIGIGIADPSYSLDQVGTHRILCPNILNSSISPPDQYPGNHGFIIRSGKSYINYPYSLGLGVDSSSGIAYITAKGDSANNNLLLQPIGGKIGIGTGNMPPAATLHVIGNQNSTGTIGTYNAEPYYSNTVASFLNYVDNTSTVPQATVVEIGALNRNIASNNPSTATNVLYKYAISFNANADGGDLEIQGIKSGQGYSSNGTPVSMAYIKSTGEIGIGTNNPKYNLDVSGNAMFTNDLSIGGRLFVSGDTELSGNLILKGTLINNDNAQSSVKSLNLSVSFLNKNATNYKVSSVTLPTGSYIMNPISYIDGVAPLNNISYSYGVAPSARIIVTVGIIFETLNNCVGIAYSYDNGLNWTPIGKIIFSILGNGVEWNGSTFVAVGQGTNTIAYSPDGTNWTAVTSSTTIFSTAGKAIAWSPTLSRWVAVGSGTNTIAYSDNGTTWTAVANSTNIFSTEGRTVVWNGTRFIAGGAGTTGIIAYSLDGITWIITQYASVPFVYTATITALAFGASKFIAGGANGKMASSTDGINWTTITKTDNTNTIASIAYNGTNTWIAVGGTVMTTSTDGVTWSGGTFGLITTGITSIAYNGTNKWIAVGSGTNVMCSSTNGTTGWTGISQNIIPTSATYVTYSGSKWFAQGLNGATQTFATSTDGVTWTQISQSVITGGITSVAYNGTNKWIAGGTTTNTLATSTDGTTWTPISQTVITTKVDSVIYVSALSIWVAIGSGTNNIAYSTNNGVTWTAGYNLTLTGGTIAWSGSRFVVASNSSNGPLTSIDGINWSNNKLGLTTQLFSSVNAICTNGTITHATGFASTGTNTIAYSYDGIGWITIVNTLFATSVIATNGTTWVVANTSTNVVHYSTNGTTFTAATGLTNNSYSSVFWTGTRFLLSGPFPLNYYSSDGITWTGFSNKMYFLECPTGMATNIKRNNAINFLTHANNTLVALGSGTNTIAYSNNGGFTWTGAGSSIFDGSGSASVWSSSLNKWVAVGSGATNTIAHSTDGVSWAGLAKTMFSIVGNAVEWNGTRFVAVGQGTNTIAYSDNGTNWTAVTGSATIFSIAGKAIAWSPTLSRWVAVGSGTNKIAYSTDNGVNWTAVVNSTNIFSTEGRTVIWNGTRFIAGGAGTTGLIAYSLDGITWTISQYASAVKLDGLVAFNGTANYVCVGLSNPSNVSTSTDGITWTAVTTPIGSQPAYCIAYGNNNKWIIGYNSTNLLVSTNNGSTWSNNAQSSITTAVKVIAYGNNKWFISNGTTSQLASSADGSTWGLVTQSAITSFFTAIVYANNTWVASGSSTTPIATSTSADNGVNWTARGSGAFASNIAYSLAYSSTLNRWVAGGSGNVYYSNDNAVTWLAGNMSPTTTSAMTYVVWTGSTFVASSGLNSRYTYLSSDGITWTAPYILFTTYISYAGNKLFVYNNNVSLMYYSTDHAATFNRCVPAFISPIKSPINGLAWSQSLNRLVATGAGGIAGNSVAYSNDLISFTGVNAPNGYGVEWNGSGFILSTDAGILNSYNGIDWYRNYVSSPPFTNISNSVSNITEYVSDSIFTYPTYLSVSVGSGGNNIAYSRDGIIWTGVTGTTIFSVQGNGIAWNGSLWVAVGNGVTHTIAYSNNGMVWTGALNAVFTTQGNGVAWNGTRFVALGEGTNSIAYSSNGISWTAVTNSTNIFTTGYSVAWNGKLFVAGGNGNYSIAYSVDGITWTGVNNSNNILTYGYCVAFNGLRFVIGGQGTTYKFAYSSDGKSWTNISSSAITTSVRGIAWSSILNIWVAVGDGTSTIAYSSDGITWTSVPSSNTIFSTAAYEVAWNGSRFIAVGQGINTIAYSSDGITWSGLGSSIHTTVGYSVSSSAYLAITTTKPTILDIVSDNLSPNVVNTDVLISINLQSLS